MNGTRLPTLFAASLFFLADHAQPARAQDTPAQGTNTAPAILDLSKSLTPRESEMRIVILRYETDRAKLSSFYSLNSTGGRGGGGGGRGGNNTAPELFSSATRFSRLKRFYTDWLAAAQKIDPARLTESARPDVKTLIEEIQRDLARLEAQARSQSEISPALPFAPAIINLVEGQLRMQKPDAEKSAAIVDHVARDIEQARRDILAGKIRLAGSVGRRATDAVNLLRQSLRNWYGFYNNYDPLFTWWLAQPYKDADQALNGYAVFLREKNGPDETNGTPAATGPSLITASPPGKLSDVPDLTELLTYPQSEMRGVIERFQNETAGARRPGNGGGGGGGAGRGGRGGVPAKVYDDWLAALAKLDFNALNRPAQVDYLLLRNRIQYSRSRLDLPRVTVTNESSRFVTFEAALTNLAVMPRDSERLDAGESATALTGLAQTIDAARKSAATELDPANASRPTRAASAAARTVTTLQSRLKDWFTRNQDADAKWGDSVSPAYQLTDSALTSYATLLRGPDTGSDAHRDTSDFYSIPPIGRDDLILQLRNEMISYTPEELIARAEKELAWCETELKKASREMHLGDNWKLAVEKLKDDHVPAGDQPYLIRDLMRESIDYIQKHDMITVPLVSSETQQMRMMTAEQQLVTPFFTGGPLISVSYPTSAMSNDAKEQAMRGNNIHFSHATVFHEMIPGHGTQNFMQPRYSAYRTQFATPFWTEGWACYWELLLYQDKFPTTPEDRIGMLFWHAHRCARIIFSLNYHLGKWTPQQGIDFLVDRIGHERENATAEVRRSFEGNYAPLYQCAYLLGAMQLMQLHRELVESHKMTERAFHDAIIHGGSMPIAMVRASLTKEKLTPDYVPNWKF